MKICSMCKNQLSDNHDTCPHCGSTVLQYIPEQHQINNNPSFYQYPNYDNQQMYQPNQPFVVSFIYNHWQITGKWSIFRVLGLLFSMPEGVLSLVCPLWSFAKLIPVASQCDRDNAGCWFLSLGKTEGITLKAHLLILPSLRMRNLRYPKGCVRMTTLRL